jgi:MFS family permease
MPKPGTSTRTGIGAPLRLPGFRALWSANLVSNFGWLIQGVGAAWLMVQLGGSADQVALVQAALQAPIFLLALFAGALADIFDRRAVLMVAQLWMLANSVLLALVTAGGLVGPWLLLLLTFSIGMGNALQGPAFQASVRELVPAQQLAAAITLNAIAFNLARSVGPAVGGGIVAGFGAEAAFIVNAVTYLGMILVLWQLRRRRVDADDLPRERLGGAIVTGLRYVAESPPIGRAVLRSGVFAFAAAAPLALMPLIARDLLGGGPTLFGVLLGAFGAGAMGGAFLVHPPRQRFGPEWLVTVLSGAFAAALLVMGLLPATATILPALAIAGTAWLGCFSSFNVSVQSAAAFWVQARVFALYQTVMFGAMALGSWLWGVVAEQATLETSLAAAGFVMLASLLLHRVTPLAEGPAPDHRPSRQRLDPQAAFPFDEAEGPVLVMVEYRIANTDAKAFARAMEEVGHLRRRNGASRWQVFQDVADAEHWIEAFTVASWLDYRRQARRATAADEAIEAEAVRFHRGEEPPLVRQMVARRRD